MIRRREIDMIDTTIIKTVSLVLMICDDIAVMLARLQHFSVTLAHCGKYIITSSSNWQRPMVRKIE